MKARLSVGLALGLLLAGAAAASSSATGSPARATGGGRFIYPSSTLSTIGFSAIGTTSTNDGAAQGQLNVVDQTDSTKYHGYVSCLNVMANTAVVEGTLTQAPSGTGQHFRLVVTDNGQGGSATGTDMIAFEPGQGDGTCQNKNNNDSQMDLAHGNVQVTAAGSSSAANAPRSSSSTSTTTLRTNRSRHTRAHRVRRAA